MRHSTLPKLCTALLWLACSDGGAPPDASPAPGPRPDILLVTLDTLRADHLGAYGAPEHLTPNLDAFAEQSLVFERMLAASSRTAPSHASLFTSRWVREHAIGYYNGPTRLADEATLAALLGRAGYETAAFVSNAMLQRRVGLDAGFDHYDDSLPDTELNRPVFERIAAKTTARTKAWLARPRSAPRFVWVQYNDPHGPYTPPSQFVAQVTADPAEPALPVLDDQRGVRGIPAYQAFADEREPHRYRARYQGEIRYLDASLGQLLDTFAASAGASGAIVAITADHGESFGEEGIWFSHGFGTTPDLAHVPFLLQARGLPGGDLPAGRVKAPVHHVDVMPTLLELAGLPVPETASGLALGPALRGEAAFPEDRPLYVDVGSEVSVYRGDAFVRVRFGEDLPEVPRGSQQGFHWRGGSSWEPAEPATDLVKLALRYPLQRAAVREAAKPDAEQQAQLRALGYLEPDGKAASDTSD